MRVHFFHSHSTLPPKYIPYSHCVRLLSSPHAAAKAHDPQSTHWGCVENTHHEKPWGANVVSISLLHVDTEGHQRSPVCLASVTRRKLPNRLCSAAVHLPRRCVRLLWTYADLHAQMRHITTCKQQCVVSIWCCSVYKPTHVHFYNFNWCLQLADVVF